MSSNTSRMAGSGRPTQFCTVSISAPTRLMTEATNQRLNGTSAIAVMRCVHQCATRSSAEPSPIARPSGERIRDAIMSGNPACQETRHVRKPGMSGNPACQETRHVRKPGMSGNPASDPGDPGNQSQDGGRPDDNPPTNIGRFEIERMAGVPDEATDAIAQMIEQRQGAAEQEQEPDPGTEEILDTFIGLRPGSGGNQPPQEQDRPGAQRNAGSAVEDR